SLPRESFGPAKPFAIAPACAAVRHESVFAPLQTSDFGSNPQPFASNTMPSATPSFASQAFSSESTTSFLSLSESAFAVIGLPLSSFGATELSATVTYLSARFEKLVRIAGAPATMPSKYRGYRCDMIIASRPPVEQPTKYE